MPVDEISKYNTNQPFEGGKEPGGAGGAGSKELPKDVLEALEKEDFEKALLLLKKYEAGGESGLFASFAPFQTIAGMFQFLLGFFRTSKEEQITPSQLAEGKGRPLPRDQLLTAPVKRSIFIGKIGMTFLEAVHNMGKTVQSMVNFFFAPALKATIVPIVKSSEKVIELSLRVQEVAKGALKGLQQLGEPIRAELTQRIEPIKNWTKERVEKLEAKVREAAAAALQGVSQVAAPVVTFLALPIEFVKNSANDLKKWAVKKSLDVRPFLQEATDQFKQLFKQVVRVNVRAAKAAYRLAKKGILFLLELFGVFIQLLFSSIGRLCTLVFNLLKKIWYGGGGPGESKRPPPRSPSSKSKR